ncbi:MAG: tetratricopeptide repeat protein, partial [Burkholderiales bacterium]|nr:tetratricopeptide repeat protein [Burkholderiales bacterium]
VRQSLGAVLLLAGQPQRAERVFRESLAKAPNNGWALYGLAEVHKRSGNEQQMRAAERLLAKAWAGEKGTLDMARL